MVVQWAAYNNHNLREITRNFIRIISRESWLRYLLIPQTLLYSYFFVTFITLLPIFTKYTPAGK